MKTIPLLAILLALPLSLPAQEETAEAPPAGLVAAEMERSRRCVPALARLAALETELEPLARRADRLQALSGAVALEDTTGVSPLDPADPVEAAVHAWFVQDQALALAWAERGDSAIDARRTEGRERLRERLLQAMQELSARGQERLAAAGDVQEITYECGDAILVRSAVLEACPAADDTPVCRAARASEPQGGFRFVDEPEALWDVSSLRPWTSPTALGVMPDGMLGGARTGVVARRGNLGVTMGIEPMIRPRAGLSPEQAERFDARVDSLGFAFQDSAWVMAPVLTLQVQAGPALGGETHYFLHFGDLSEPARDVVWTAPFVEGPMQVVLPLGRATLDRLAAGDLVSLTAVRFAEEGVYEGEAVYSLALTDVGQASSVTALVSYMASGQLAADLAQLTPPAPPPAER